MAITNSENRAFTRDGFLADPGGRSLAPGLAVRDHRTSAGENDGAIILLEKLRFGGEHAAGVFVGIFDDAGHDFLELDGLVEVFERGRVEVRLAGFCVGETPFEKGGETAEGFRGFEGSHDNDEDTHFKNRKAKKGLFKYTVSENTGMRGMNC